VQLAFKYKFLYWKALSSFSTTCFGLTVAAMRLFLAAPVATTLPVQPYFGPAYVSHTFYLTLQSILATLASYFNHILHQLRPSSFNVRYQFKVTNPLLNVITRKLRHRPRGKVNWMLENLGLRVYRSPVWSLAAKIASI
jgi:hypothetical protein